MQRSTTETFLLYGVMALTMLIATGFVVATVAWGYGFPAVFVSLILAIFIGTLAYTSLGAQGGDVFNLGPAKLTGVIAGIIAVFWFVNGPMEKGMRDAKAIAIGKDAQKQIDAAEAKLRDEQKLRHKAEQRASEIEASANDHQSNSVAAVLKRIETSKADDPLGSGVLRLMKDAKGPFNRTLQVETLTARFNGKVSQGTFIYCRDKHPELQDKQVRFEIVDPDQGTSQKIELRAGGDFGAAICPSLKFDVHLGCDAAAALIGDSAADCDATHGVAWKDPQANKIYDLTATVLNPELTP